MGLDSKYSVSLSTRKEVEHLILHKHYAQRLPSISYAFVLRKHHEITGCMTVGKPASNSLCVGVCGQELSSQVFEINRVVILETEPNLASWFLSKSLKLLDDKNMVLVSYADKGVGHVGYIYQATNFIYTGATKERTDKYTEQNKHSRHYTDVYKNLRKVRTSKHRYITFVGSKVFKRDARRALRYIEKPYPKEETKRYVLGERIKTKIINRDTGEQYYE